MAGASKNKKSSKPKEPVKQAAAPSVAPAPKHEPIITSDEDITKAKEISPYLTSGSEDISVPLSAESIKAFQIYAAMLRKWNEKMNLTNIVDDKGIAIRHFIDSLTLVTYIENEERKQGRRDLSLIDVGTGAGFPGIPLKVTMSELSVTLLDSLKKRIGFLDAVCEKLQLQDIHTIHARAEEGAKSKLYREKFDISTARAVAALPTLCEYCLPYVKVGGIFLAMKGHAEEETEAAQKAIVTLGGTLETVHNFTLPGTDMQRSIVVIRKIRPTPPKYPRGQGKPEKEPIQ
ncbi:MAG: 16S rRNA (guanine(527)-N(7))-methyltransferase RsmG [Clostridiales bacterium]|nr:16S rRNA (guanine(527)-N(7))-methyltransferase RsmG [Clostridiales bacterium]